MKKKYVMIIGLVIILIVLFYKYIAQFLGFIPTGTSIVFTEKYLLYSRFIFWGMTIFLFLYAHFAEKQSLLLKKPSRHGIGFYILSIATITIAIIVISSLVMFAIKSLGYATNQQAPTLKNMLSILKAHPLLLLFTCITAGVTEEIIFRGYIQTRIELVFNSPVSGIIISAFFFSLAHSFYGTVQEIVGPFIIGLVFAIYYYKYKNIYALMVFHFLFDYTQILLLHT
ncbi:MAG TPA: type II CAAX endopeptidase family protein [Hanamia sp.]|nr:type II CAAX endopeptidase family protein [Hanamia sp.]